MLSFTEIPNLSWSDLLANDMGSYRSPHTVHLPIHPAYSTDFLHVDGAMNVCRRRFVPGLSSNTLEKYLEALKSETLLVQFALGSAPFVPDFAHAEISLDEGDFPIASVRQFVPTATGRHSGLLYEWEYASCPIEGLGQSLLSINCKISNLSSLPQEAHARAKVCFPKENEVFEYHYVSFYWDNTKYCPSPQSGLRNHAILYNGEVIGKIIPGEFTVQWEAERDFVDADYNTVNSQTNFVPPSHRYRNVRDAIYLHTQLEPGETRAFELAFLVNYEEISASQREFLFTANHAVCRQLSRGHFDSLLPEKQARLISPADKWDKIFSYLPLANLQLLVQAPDIKGLVPTQGGTSERHFVWVWEAVYMMLPMLQLGHFAPVRQTLDYIFELQDAGEAPLGRLVSTAGAIGTTGPKWLSTTGAALALAADYYRYSQDESYLDLFLPKIERAVDWIVRELRATRQFTPDGQRTKTHGLMPFGHATDGDIGFIVAFTDANIFWGLQKAVILFEELQHPRAQELRAELDLYQQDILVAVEGITHANGFIERKIVTDDPDEIFMEEFEVICGAHQLAFCGVLDVASQVFQKYLEYYEQNLASGIFNGRAGYEVFYMGIGELVWQDIYLQMGQWKKAFIAARANLRYGMTQDAFQVQERFNINDPAFCPWQPNGSGNGKILTMILKSFWYEQSGYVTLLAGIPFSWLRQNKHTSLQNLHTPTGRVSIEIEVTGPQKCDVTIRGEGAEAIPAQLCFPSYYESSLVESLDSCEKKFALTYHNDDVDFC
jgi:hypothetical protein